MNSIQSFVASCQADPKQHKPLFQAFQERRMKMIAIRQEEWEQSKNPLKHLVDEPKYRMRNKLIRGVVGLAFLAGFVGFINAQPHIR